MVILAVVLLTTSIGCRSSCGERRGLFGLCKSDHAPQDGFLAGYSGKPAGECIGEPLPGQLMSFPASSGVPSFPAQGPALPNELPMPQPSDLIPGQRVPFAPPHAAPAPIDGPTTTSIPGSRGK